MSEKVVQFPRDTGPSTENLSNALGTIDDVRQLVEDGEAVAALIVTLNPKDGTKFFLVNVGDKNRVHFLGAAALLTDWVHSYARDD